jgi:hypothetical protein
MDHKTTPAAPEVAPQPVINADGIKIYPTSFVPVKAHMEPSRIPTAQLSNLQIEVIHVGVFLALTVFLFISMWKKPNVRN